MAYHGNNKLYRDTDEKVFGGVCAGLSEFFKIDVTIIRVIVAALAIFYGTGIAIYIILWVLLPEKHDVIR